MQFSSVKIAPIPQIHPDICRPSALAINPHQETQGRLGLRAVLEGDESQRPYSAVASSVLPRRRRLVRVLNSI